MDKDGIKNKMQAFQNRLEEGFERIGKLSRLQRMLICLVSFGIIGGAYYYFFFIPIHEDLKRIKSEYTTASNQLATYKRKAAKLPKMEKLIKEKQEEFHIAMEALPDKKEIPSLLRTVSKAGTNSGLSFHLFQPQAEVPQAFFSEIPVSIKVQGGYHQITDFFFQVSKLNRIVNIKNVKMVKKGDDPFIDMSCKAVTYMFIEAPVQPKKK